ncbi:SDR family NAD(P)-dependent oxidoreductase [Agromyces mediolanus]|uniref:SDR family NAD(P)-dependent oxidoreductase n=1 Tax=Agromyces mediolanus TaxID=41986 RepID=UPI00255A02DA
MDHPEIAVVTGAGRGLGRATALALAENGYRVVVATRSAASADAVVSRIEEAGGEALPLQLDIGDPRSIDSATTTLLTAVAATWSGSPSRCSSTTRGSGTSRRWVRCGPPTSTTRSPSTSAGRSS